MHSLDLNGIINDSVAFAQKELGATYKKLKPYAEAEFTRFAENAARLAQLKLQGRISDAELKTRLQLQQHALATVLLAIQGISLIMAEKIVNGVLNIVAKALRSALNISLPG